ncbi:MULTISPECIES: hypothetical protein [unclassified Pseudofrankia]|uniref:hypothetical protein n=1 Tax=unclassified Pseudofrankia TaxID=2994372 RepID=UPI0012FFD21C|nr:MULTISPECIES: hypothetical protein [unclassified Pseudofrankia]MDT3445067.1 hypothetical protein [Pseudofrankia sp. BMG5.37]
MKAQDKIFESLGGDFFQEVHRLDARSECVLAAPRDRISGGTAPVEDGGGGDEDDQ